MPETRLPSPSLPRVAQMMGGSRTDRGPPAAPPHHLGQDPRAIPRKSSRAQPPPSPRAPQRSDAPRRTATRTCSYGSGIPLRGYSHGLRFFLPRLEIARNHPVTDFLDKRVVFVT